MSRSVCAGGTYDLTFLTVGEPTECLIDLGVPTVHPHTGKCVVRPYMLIPRYSDSRLPIRLDVERTIEELNIYCMGI